MLELAEKPEWSYYALRRWWNRAKDTLAVDEDTGEPWWPQNSKEAYNSGLESLADALKNFSKSRNGQRKGRKMGFPRFKSKDSGARDASRTRPARSALSTMTHMRCSSRG